MLIDGWLNDVFDVNCMLPVFLHEELTRSSGMEKINHSNGWWTDKGAEATIFLVKVKKQPMVVKKMYLPLMIAEKGVAKAYSVVFKLVSIILLS